jgi:hypothetical protein
MLGAHRQVITTSATLQPRSAATAGMTTATELPTWAILDALGQATKRNLPIRSAVMAEITMGTAKLTLATPAARVAVIIQRIRIAILLRCSAQTPQMMTKTGWSI